MKKEVDMKEVLNKIFGLMDTNSLTEWENSLLKKCWKASVFGNLPENLNVKEVQFLKAIYNKYF